VNNSEQILNSILASLSDVCLEEKRECKGGCM
jgi:hypothetical protein